MQINRYNCGQRNSLSFWRNNTGHEIYLLLESAGQFMPVEIKSGQTFARDWLEGLRKWLTFPGNDAKHPTLIYGGEDRWQEDAVQILPWREIGALEPKIES